MFKIRSSSWIRYIITLIVVALAGSSLFFKIFPDDNSWHLLILIALLIPAAIYLTRFTSVVIIEVTLTNEGINIVWLKNYEFQSNSELSINRDEVYSYSFLPDYLWDLIKLKLNNGKTFRIWHKNGSFIKDDLYDLVAALDKKFPVN